MIRYPLYVTIDTNIFDSTGYDLGDDGTLGHLYSYVFVETRKMIENHNAKFAIRIEMNLETKEYRLSKFKAFLNESMKFINVLKN